MKRIPFLVKFTMRYHIIKITESRPLQNTVKIGRQKKLTISYGHGLGYDLNTKLNFIRMEELQD